MLIIVISQKYKYSHDDKNLTWTERCEKMGDFWHVPPWPPSSSEDIGRLPKPEYWMSKRKDDCRWTAARSNRPWPEFRWKCRENFDRTSLRWMDNRKIRIRDKADTSVQNGRAKILSENKLLVIQLVVLYCSKFLFECIEYFKYTCLHDFQSRISFVSGIFEIKTYWCNFFL